MKPLSTEASCLLRCLEKMVLKKVNGDRRVPDLHKLLTHSFTNTKLARDAGIDVDHLQRARAELVSSGLIWPVTALPYEQGRKKKTRAKQARHAFTLRIKKFRRTV
jgi:hypothetical protein